MNWNKALPHVIYGAVILILVTILVLTNRKSLDRKFQIEQLNADLDSVEMIEGLIDSTEVEKKISVHRLDSLKNELNVIIDNAVNHHLDSLTLDEAIAILKGGQ